MDNIAYDPAVTVTVAAGGGVAVTVMVVGGGHVDDEAEDEGLELDEVVDVVVWG